MKLKTLKDINWVDRPGLILRNELKSEAIKRVKSCKRPVDFSRSDRCGHNKKEYCDVCKREIWFNNLTEKDLEGGKNET